MLVASAAKADRITSFSDSSETNNNATFIGSALGYYIWNCTNTTTGYGQWVQVPALFLTNCNYGPGIYATLSGGSLNITNVGQPAGVNLTNLNTNVGTIAYSNSVVFTLATNGSVRGLTIADATVSRAAKFDANGVLTNDVALAGTIAYSNSVVYLQRTNDTVRGLTVANATVSKIASYDANGVLTNDVATPGSIVTAVSSTGGIVSSITSGTLALSGSTVCYAGSSGNFGIGVSQTIWWALNNSKTNQDATDVAGGTRSVMCRGGTLTNLYVVMSGTVGNNNSNWFGIFTNGVATTMAVLITGTSATTGNDTTHAATVVAGDQVGIKCLSSSSVTAVKAAWGLEER